ncbi:MAG: hypothetical protein WCD18_25875, partial [Thermosynechococcaceae cyanobacterium]
QNGSKSTTLLAEFLDRKTVQIHLLAKRSQFLDGILDGFPGRDWRQTSDGTSMLGNDKGFSSFNQVK